MEFWLRLSWIEWYRGFLIGSPNRDFFSLTALLSLTLILSLLLWGGREGLLNRFVDVSVGSLEGYGIPIWLAATRGINRELLNQTRENDLQLHPYREVESHEVSLPGTRDGDVASWNDEIVPFRGRAVSFQDPLWLTTAPPRQAQDSGLPLEVVLNRTLFRQFFNCSTYTATLQKKMPLLNVTKGKGLDCLDEGAIWLDVKVRQDQSGSDLLPFRIHWKNHIPTLEKLVFLFPLSTFNVLKLSYLYPGFNYYPEAQETKSTRLGIVKIWQGKELISNKDKNVLKTCFPKAKFKRNSITLNHPLPTSWISDCLKRHNTIPLKIGRKRLSPPFLQIDSELTSHYFRYDSDHIFDFVCPMKKDCIPCLTVPSLQKINGVQCETSYAAIDGIAAVGSYTKAFAYVKTRDELPVQIDRIKELSLRKATKAFYIHATYEDALVRFRFIDRIMRILEYAFSPFFLVFLVLLLMIQVSIVIIHRRHNYGILLAKGVSLSQIRAIIFTQVTLSFALAFGFGIIINESMQFWLAQTLAAMTQEKPYVDHIVAGSLDLLPLNIRDYLLVGCAVLGSLLLITDFLLRRALTANSKEPANLF